MARWLLTPLLYVSLTGCALSLSGPEPHRSRNKFPECDTSKSLVVLDGLMATTMGIVTLSVVGSDEPALALLPLAIGALYLGGAVKGNGAVDKCRAAIKDFTGSYSPEGHAGLDDQDQEAAAAARRPRRNDGVIAGPSSMPPDPPMKSPPVQAPPMQAPPVQAPPAQAQTQPPQQPAAPPGPEQAQPPTAQRPPTAAPGRPARPAPPASDDWSDFWREVP